MGAVCHTDGHNKRGKLKAVECNKFIYPMETERNMIRHIGELDMAAVREDLREFEAYLKSRFTIMGISVRQCCA